MNGAGRKSSDAGVGLGDGESVGTIAGGDVASVVGVVCGEGDVLGADAGAGDALGDGDA